VHAVWYDRQGPAAEVLTVGDLPDPQPGPGEVRVRLTFSGINPGDTKKRRGWLGSSMPYPRVIPYSDGAGVIDAVGQGVDRDDKAGGSGCSTPSPTARSAPPRSSPSCPPSSPPTYPTTFPIRWAPAWVSPASPRDGPCSLTVPSPA
jgi:NADPH:quinone reductase-like Zn-dependent oxidoreductase